MKNRVIFVVLDNYKQPILASDSFEGLREALDEYCGATPQYNYSSKFIGFTPFEMKYPSEYEGYFEYEFLDNLNEAYKEKYYVYCVDFFANPKFLRILYSDTEQT